jgi:hypothetical protein
MSAISEKVIGITKPYFGPAAESFLSRQCKSHLKIELGDLAPTHLKDLAKWVELGTGLLMDQAKGAELGRKIAAL